MKLSDRQAIVLFDIVKESMRFVGGMAGYDAKTIHDLVNEILNQQSGIVRDLAQPEKGAPNDE